MSPADLLTDEQCNLIREHKTELIELLAAPALTPAEQADIHEAIKERAAIREFDGGESKSEAERQARSEMRVYRLLVAMREGPAKWVTMLAPGVEPDETRRHACDRFGEYRVLDVVGREMDG